MKKILPLVLAATAFCTLSMSACSTYDAATQQALATSYGQSRMANLDLYDNVISILGTVNSPDSADAAVTRLLPLVSQHKNRISGAQSLLTAPSKMVEEKVNSAYGDKLMGCMRDICAEAARLEKAEFYGSTALQQAVMYFAGDPE